MLLHNVVIYSLLLVVIKAQEIPLAISKIENMSLALRIQRDIAMNITIDQFIWPALDMSTAFFGNDYSLEKLSQINQPLWMGYKRLIFDIYWNSTHWQLCPTLNCTSFHFEEFIQSINEYLELTQVKKEPTKTNLITLILNLHDLSTTFTKKETNLSSIILNTINPQVLYTPSNLTLDRENTTIQQQYQEDLNWPPWLFIIEQQVQLLIGLGSIQENASFTISNKDKSILFGTNTLGNMHLDRYTCADDSISWSFVNDKQTPFTYNTSSRLVSCGYSPYFTHSINNTQEHISSTIWSWDINQPNSEDGTKRCASMLQKNGRWVTSHCGESLRVACKLATDDTNWVLTNTAYNYDRSLTACPSNYIFDIPRIPRQNMYLRQAIKDANITDEKIWLNLNLLYNDVDCWVIGRYGTCWWSINSQTEYLGLITTSVVAGVIILLLVSIFTWVKCARLWRNRNSKARKAMVKAMLARREYVTVPA